MLAFVEAMVASYDKRMPWQSPGDSTELHVWIVFLLYLDEVVAVDQREADVLFESGLITPHFSYLCVEEDTIT